MKHLVTAVLAASILLSGPARADGSLCDYQLAYAVTVEADRIHLINEHQTWRLHGDQLYLDGEVQALNAGERKQLNLYRQGLAQLTADAGALAREGISLGIEAATLAMAALADDQAADRLSQQMATVAERLRARYDGHHLPAGTLRDHHLDAALEAEIETLVLRAAGDMAGGIAAFAWSAITDPAHAEARGARIERLVERRVQPRADALEARADSLCKDLRKLDALERRLDRFDLLRSVAASV